MAKLSTCMTWGLTLALAFVATFTVAGDEVAPTPSKPAILIDNWGGTVDLDYMKRLQAAGFEVDAIHHRDLTWERLQGYNVLLLVDFPQEGKVTHEPSGGPGSGANLEETLALVDRFLAVGGGVMVNLLQHHYSPVFYNSTQKALERWGARKPLERVAMAPDRYVRHPRLGHSFYVTENVQDSPVSEGVARVWYPGFLREIQGGGDWGTAGPIEVDDSWTVVVRAPKNSRTEPLQLVENKPGVPWYDAPYVRPDGVEEPPLFAIRDLGPGRLALFHAHPFYHFGSGLSWLHNGVMLDKGLNNQPSDFGKLLDQTFRWLAAPSLGGGTLGGYVTAADRWMRTLEKPDANGHLRYMGPQGFQPYSTQHDPELKPPVVKLHQGIVGPRTAYSGGQGTVAEYAAVAREKGVAFIIFLEDLTELTQAEFTQLVADCKENSGDDLLLLAGYRIRTNLGNQFFHFGLDPLFMHDKFLSPDRSVMILQPQKEDGSWETSRFIDFIFDAQWNTVNSMGYFDFIEPMKSGGLAVHDLRLFSMVGVVYYRNGELVEDVTDQYLLTNAGTMSGTPVAINLLDSPAALATMVDVGRGLTHAEAPESMPDYYAIAAGVEGSKGLTYATAPSVRALWDHALRWNSQFAAFNVFPSSGPIILHWPRGMYRTGTYAGELFVAERMLTTPFLQVVAEAGLKEVSVYDGDRLFRRFLPGGAKEFSTRLFLSGSLQRNMSVVATDANGGKAVSFPLRGWNDGAPVCVFCGDHVNDCGGMRLYRGPGWQRSSSVPQIPETGAAWDGMGMAVGKLELLPMGPVLPSFQTSTDQQGGRPYQTPVMELCDERAWRGRSVSRGVQLPGSPHRNPWTDYGPIEPAPLVDMVGVFTEWDQYQDGVAMGWGPFGRRQGPTATLFTHVNTFKENMVLNQVHLSNLWRKDLEQHVMLVHGRGETLVAARDAAPRGERAAPGMTRWTIETGDWFAAISPNEANAMLLVNRGVPLELSVDPASVVLREALPQGGLRVAAGDQRLLEWFYCSWPMDKPIPHTDALLRWVRYFQQPDGFEILRGVRVAAPPGVIELEAERGAVEVKVPRSADSLDANLPFRVAGFNPRWSAILWQKEGYVGAGRYGKAQNRFRTLGMDFDGRVYFPVPTDQAALHHLVVGQPVVAAAGGEELFINVVCLKDAAGGTPPLWHVSVNNPTDAPITATLTRTMELPGVEWAGETITLAPGEHRILVHPVGVKQ